MKLLLTKSSANKSMIFVLTFKSMDRTKWALNARTNISSIYRNLVYKSFIVYLHQ